MAGERVGNRPGDAWPGREVDHRGGAGEGSVKSDRIEDVGLDELDPSPSRLERSPPELAITFVVPDFSLSVSIPA